MRIVRIFAGDLGSVRPPLRVAHPDRFRQSKGKDSLVASSIVTIKLEMFSLFFSSRRSQLLCPRSHFPLSLSFVTFFIIFPLHCIAPPKMAFLVIITLRIMLMNSISLSWSAAINRWGFKDRSSKSSSDITGDRGHRRHLSSGGTPVSGLIFLPLF